MHFLMKSKMLLVSAVALAALLLLPITFGGNRLAPANALTIKQTTGQHLINNKELTIENVGVVLEKTSITKGTVSIQIVQDGNVLDHVDLSTDKLSLSYRTVTVEFSDPVKVDDSNFDVVVVFEGSGQLYVQKQADRIVGNAFVEDEEKPNVDPTLT